MATSILSPSAKIVVYIVRNDGEIVADSVTIKVNGAFENDVSSTTAGEEVLVNIFVGKGRRYSPPDIGKFIAG
jgi:uncharacterized protein with ATP-grasp and redox domains